MDVLQNMPRSGVIVISVIAVLFVLAVVMLFYTRVRYRFLESRASGSSQSTRGFRAAILTEYTEAYKEKGPVLYIRSLERCEQCNPEVATF